MFKSCHQIFDAINLATTVGPTFFSVPHSLRTCVFSVCLLKVSDLELWILKYDRYLSSVMGISGLKSATPLIATLTIFVSVPITAYIWYLNCATYTVTCFLRAHNCAEKAAGFLFIATFEENSWWITDCSCADSAFNRFLIFEFCVECVGACACVRAVDKTCQTTNWHAIGLCLKIIEI